MFNICLIYKRFFRILTSLPENPKKINKKNEIERKRVKEIRVTSIRYFISF